MIAGPSLRGLKRIGSGSYGDVYASRDDAGVVFKHAQNDGTRDYLEWVILRTLEGRRMPGMPWVYGLWSDGPDHYRVSMRRYIKADLDGWYRLDRGTWPAHIRDLVLAFENETGIEADDVHSNNVMQDDNGELILLDPSSEDYSGSTAPIH